MANPSILELLIAERDRLNLAIEALQGPKRRGRPPKNRSLLGHDGPFPMVKKGRRTFTAAQRKQQAERMRKYWAKRRKGARARKG